MKKKLLSRIRFIFIWFCIYILVMAFGIFLSLLITYFYQKNMQEIAKSDLSYYLEQNRFDPDVRKNGGNNFIYNTRGNRIAFSSDPNFEKRFDCDSYAKNILPKLQDKDMVYTIFFSPNPTCPIHVTIALPMENNGMFLFIRELDYLKDLLIVMFFSATLLIILSAVYAAFIIRKHKALETMQRKYVDNISHELKSPIASVRALTETMYDGLVPEPEKQKQYCSIMLKELQRLEHTVSYMLELSRIQNHKTACSKSVLTPNEVLGAVIQRYAVLCDDMELDFLCFPSPGSTPLLYTNGDMAARILDILLNNAVKFTSTQGRIRIHFTEKNNKLIVTVKDNGSGIAFEDRPHIFERFYKGDKAHNEKGSGLGLAIASEIAACLDEGIWLQNTSDEGTAFSFTIQKR